MKRTTPLLVLVFLSLVFAVLACNLSGSSGPPTLVPRPTATPPPTIGYATLSPAELPQQATVAPPRTDVTLTNLLNQVDADHMIMTIDTLQGFGTRFVNSSADQANWGVGAASNYLLQQFQAISSQSQGKFSVFPQTFSLDYNDTTTNQTNIIGYLGGDTVGGGTILLAAHYDSISIAFQDPTAYAPGADDNGSGIAALLEMARILSAEPHHASILFVAFAAEEIGRKGSLAFVNDYLVPRGITLDAVINMDIIGSATGPDGSIDDTNLRLFSAGPNDGSPSRLLARRLELLSTIYTPNLKIDIQDAVDREGRFSDHMSFSDANYPAVRFVEGLEDTSRQHNDRDTIDDVQAPYLRQVTQTILAMTTALADGPRPPANVSLRDNGDGTRTLIWEPTAGAVSYVVALRRPGSMRYDQYFEIADTSVRWTEFVPSSAAVAIAAEDASGLMGPTSAEYYITN
jgi:peptidase M28-like protein